MTRHILVLLLFVVLGSDGSLQAGGPWTQAKGHGYTQLSFTYLRYHEVINGYSRESWFNVTDLKRHISDHTLKYYVEYGVTNKLTAFATVPFKLLNAGNELLPAPTDLHPSDTIRAGALNSFGNIYPGVKYQLLDKKWLLSAQFTLGTNTASYDHLTGLRSGYDAWTFAPALSVGTNFSFGYFLADFQYQWKTNGYADNVFIRSEVGLELQRPSGLKSYIILELGGLVPVTNGTYDDRNSTHTALYRDEEGFIYPGLKINHSITDHFTFNISSMGAFWARYGGNELTYTAGVAYEW